MSVKYTTFCKFSCYVFTLIKKKRPESAFKVLV